MIPAEIAACVGVATATAAAVLRATRAHGPARLAVGVLLVTGTATAAAFHRVRTPRAEPPPNVPGPSNALGYVTSAACLPCHASEHASFGRTWHRTMTQAATPSSVLAPFERRGDAVFYEGKRIVLTTGSHREQAYWTAGARGDLEIVPVVWLPQAKALIARRDAFILPPNEPMPEVHWGSSCIACHAVAGEPRRDAAHDAWDTRAAELGIACEACHGPGAEHVEHYRDPVARYVQTANKHIVQPAKLDAARANAVCGQCHAYAFPRDEAAWWKDGYARAFRAGDALAPSRILLSPEVMAGGNDAPVIDAPASAIFWPDGDVRVGGREYNGLVGSKCKATCVDCHSMHTGDPAGQLKPGAECTTTCHTSDRDRNHSKHAAVSCVDCHMPKTSFALLSAVRSHRIAIPHEHGDDGKPTACELCHLDKPSGPNAFGLRAGLAGDAGVRALVADALGRSPDATPAAASDGPRQHEDGHRAQFSAALLDAMAADPYAAVRFIALRSRRHFPNPAPPLDPELVRSLLAARDNRAVTIAE